MEVRSQKNGGLTMKIIFSRKGYDKTSGGMPSPIFPDDTLCSFPIPSDQKPKLKDVWFQGKNLGSLVRQLNEDPEEKGVHLDPDLYREARPRKAGWRPCFGQVGAPQTHLKNQQVGEGDVFLFFGWFRRVLQSNGKFHYQPHAPDIHCLFGWLQVGTMYHPGLDDRNPPTWSLDHPHVQDAKYYAKNFSNNTLYVASDRLRFPGLRRPLAGGGVFPRFTESLQLTEPGQPRSFWRFPECFSPREGQSPLSNHKPEEWTKDKNGILLKPVGKKLQDSVLDCEEYPGVFAWLREIFKSVKSE